MNLPNKLTVLRVILVPFFVLFMLWEAVPHNNLIALVLFGVASFTDFLDGHIARKHNLVTNFGKFMDPLADKIMVMAALICFVALGSINPSVVILIMFREFAITSIRLVAASTGQVIAANNWGKAKTVSQIISIVLIMIFAYVVELGTMGIVPLWENASTTFYVIGEVAMCLSTVICVYSGYVYIKDNWGVIKDTK